MAHELVQAFHDYCEEAGYFGPNGNSLWLWVGEDTLDDSDPNYVDKIVAVLADPIKFLAHRLAATGELAKATNLTVYAEPHGAAHRRGRKQDRRDLQECFRCPATRSRLDELARSRR